MSGQNRKRVNRFRKFDRHINLGKNDKLCDKFFDRHNFHVVVKWHNFFL